MRIIFLFIFTLTQSAAFGQHLTGKIFYEIKLPSITKQSTTVTGLLEFADSISLFSYYKISLEDSIYNLSSVYIDPNRGVVIKATEYDTIGTLIYRDFRRGIIRSRVSQAKPLTPFVVNDDWIEIKWTISSEKKVIQNYECQKATGTFRGRNYIVWFAGQLPYNYGPWKLFGLPGLILEAYDSENKVHFMAKQIQYPDTSIQVIQIPTEKEVKTIREFSYFQDYYMEQVERAFQHKMPKGITIKLDEKDKTTPKKLRLQRKYQLESRYEWEKDTLSNKMKIDRNKK